MNAIKLKKFNFELILILFASLIYLIGSLLWGFFKYPHEDVLILYRYIEIFSQSGVISFNLDQPPIEGATDFFWLIILTIFYKFGIDPFLSSQIINTLSLFGILYLLHSIYLKEFNKFYQIIFIFIFINSGPIIGASILGFSALTFCFIMMLVFYFAFKGDLAKWSLFSIIFCLLRPEAFIFFLPTVLIIYNIVEGKDRFLKYFIAVVLIGLCYLIFRFNYFNEYLPLPITVKSIGGETSLLRYFARISELTSTFFISLCLPLLTYYFLNRNKFFSLSNNFLKILLLLLPVILIYTFMLSTGHASQNIFFRYFAPIYFIVFVLSLYCMKAIYPNKIIFSLLTLIIIAGSLDHSNLLNRTVGIEKNKISNPTTNIFAYFSEKINPLTYLAYSINKHSSVKTIMLTEAGNLPYISKKNSIDMAGLNFPIFSKRPVSCGDFEKFDADIVEIDVGPVEQFSFESVINDISFPYCGVINKERLYDDSQKLKFEELKLIDKYKNNYFTENHKNATVSVAANNTLYCMKNDENYPLIFYRKDTDKLFFLKNNTQGNMLLSSCELTLKGYYLD